MGLLLAGRCLVAAAATSLAAGAARGAPQDDESALLQTTWGMREQPGADLPLDNLEWTEICTSNPLFQPARPALALWREGSQDEGEAAFLAGDEFETLRTFAAGIRKMNQGGRFINLARTDDMGSATINILDAKHISWLFGMEYLGAYPDKFPNTTHALLRTLGLPAPLQALPKGTVTVGSVKELRDEVRRNPGGTVFINHRRLDIMTRFVQNYNKSNIGFREVLRKSANFPPAELWSASATVRVAIHVRRGDLMVKFSHRKKGRHVTPNLHYLRIMDQIAERVPGAEFVVFGQAPFSCRQNGFLLDDFARRPDVILRIGESVEEAWSHIANADILIKSNSSFCFVPSLFNTRGSIQTSPCETELCFEDLERKLAPFMPTASRRLAGK